MPPSRPQARSLPAPPPASAPAPAVEVCGLLPVELAVGRATVLGGSEALEAVVDELGVLLVEVLVRHHVGRARVDLVTAHLQGGVRSGGQGAEAAPRGQLREVLLVDAAGASGPRATDRPAQGSSRPCPHPDEETEKVN